MEEHTCPYCGIYIEGECYYELPMGDSSEFKCEGCGKPIVYYAYVERTFEKKEEVEQENETLG